MPARLWDRRGGLNYCLLHTYMCFVFSTYKNRSICDAREPQASSALPVLSLATCAQSWLACSLRFCRAAGESRPLQNAAAGVCWEPHQSRSRVCGTAGRSEAPLHRVPRRAHIPGDAQPPVWCEWRRLRRSARPQLRPALAAVPRLHLGFSACLLSGGFSVVIVS